MQLGKDAHFLLMKHLNSIECYNKNQSMQGLFLRKKVVLHAKFI
jgi:hypothetical protein